MDTTQIPAVPLRKSGRDSASHLNSTTTTGDPKTASTSARDVTNTELGSAIPRSNGSSTAHNHGSGSNRMLEDAYQLLVSRSLVERGSLLQAPDV